MKPAHILLVEDNPSDVHLTEQALRESPLGSRLHVVPDGDRALEFLERSGSDLGPPRPDLILLDLNLPGMDGRSLLRALKGDARFRTIPVIVLTTSTAEADIRECYDRHANCYIVKPLEFDKFETVVRQIEEFWFRYAALARSSA